MMTCALHATMTCSLPRHVLWRMAKGYTARRKCQYTEWPISQGWGSFTRIVSVKICFICVYRPVVKVKAITWTLPPALRNVPKYAIKFFADRDKFFCWRISKKPVCFSGKHKVANLNPYSKGWTTETSVVVLALINAPCKSSLSSDVKNDFCYPSSFLSCKYIRKGR